ncbi:ribulose-phosphate 3-epimerase [Desulfobacterales bacterium HSG16]|nr:ribulose-phosphate 3-epimerase [Desulfobacterales bacterium HSG16]
MTIIAPSILSADFSRLKDEIQAVEKAGAQWIHIDVMDGHFVPNITMGPIVVEAVRKCTSLPLDVHLMIENPDRYIGDFAKAGADYISVHAEACTHLHRTVGLIKEHNVKPGVALNPATALCSIDWVLDELDFVLIMSVNPGFGGQSFIENSLEKIEAFRDIVDEEDYDILIQIDGGVNENTVESIVEAGADVLVAGSAIFNTDDYAEAIRKITGIKQ